eukprot:TRINITY_DN9333_c0_g1_i1.p1 TRINITY_DN9333_c0_g1~~TRINITY_DN9333_c0_g1_i1.p1  ORF type:complete len:173 (-),score=67.36 TRINITY_DN9333_c0_g1_i1:152-670(-)
MAGQSARDYGGGLSTNGWQSAGPQNVSLTKDDGFDEDIAQAAGIVDEDPNKSKLDQKSKEVQQRKNELKEFEEMQKAQTNATPKVNPLAALAAEKAAKEAAKRKLPGIFKVKNATRGSEEPTATEDGSNAKKQKTDEKVDETAAPKPAATGGGIGGLGGYDSDSDDDEEEAE